MFAVSIIYGFFTFALNGVYSSSIYLPGVGPHIYEKEENVIL